MSLNYEFCLQCAESTAGPHHPRILDYGCGTGEMVKLGRSRGLEIVGVDSFSGPFADWLGRVDPSVASHVSTLDHDRIPFADASFDAVLSNQVFEHIAEPERAMREIHRVLRPGGTLIATFPVRETWFEGHVGLYFVHWLPGVLQDRYLGICYALGLGLRRECGVSGWQHTIRAMTYYYRRRDIISAYQNVFGRPPKSLSADWMLFRLAASPRLRPLVGFAGQSWLRRLLAWVCHVRAGEVVSGRK
jgi:SAM-dependent methyltransferase